jgi:hypothetical protein
MKATFFAILMLACAASNAQSYKCPAKNAGAGLTSAEIRAGSRSDAHVLHGDVDHVADGTKIHFGLPDEVPRWLVCQYGGHRVDGSPISGPAAIGAHEAWIQLDPMAYACDLVIRGRRSHQPAAVAWSAEASCEKKKPPPPDLV